MFVFSFFCICLTIKYMIHFLEIISGKATGTTLDNKAAIRKNDNSQIFDLVYNEALASSDHFLSCTQF